MEREGILGFMMGKEDVGSGILRLDVGGKACGTKAASSDERKSRIGGVAPF